MDVTLISIYECASYAFFTIVMEFPAFGARMGFNSGMTTITMYSVLLDGEVSDLG